MKNRIRASVQERVEPENRPARGGRLAIHTRRVLTGVGEVQLDRTVDCPRRTQAIDVEICLSCPDSHGEVTQQGGRGFVRCDEARSSGDYRLEELTRSTLSGLGLHTPVSEVMTPCVICVRADVATDSIIALMDQHRISAVPVVDERGRPIGLVSKTDLLRELQDRPSLAQESVALSNDGVVYDPGSGFHLDSLGRVTAEDVMSKQVVWLPPEAPIASAAGIMVAEHIHRAVVLGDDRRVIGIVSSLDLLKWMAREAGFAIADDTHAL